MNKFVLILFMCGLSAFAQSRNANNAVAVLEFQKTGSITNDDVQTLSNRFRTMLFQTRTFNVIERNKMKEILKEQEFILSDDCNTNECAVQVGQLLGVEYMIAGDIGLIGDTYTIDLRMIDVRTGQLVQTHSKDYDGKIAGLLEIMKQIANSFSQFQKDAAKMKPDESKTAVSSASTEKDKQASKTQSTTASTTAGAKSKSKGLAFRLLFGTATPTGKFDSEAGVKGGSNLMVGCSYIFGPRIQIGIDFGVQNFDQDGSNEKMVPFLASIRFYTISKRFKNYLTLGLGTTKVTFPGFDKSFSTSKFGTGVSYEIINNLNAEMSLDFTKVGTKNEFGYDKTVTQFGLGINYNLAF
ncbi:outer membrane beta-barrel protein [bacterium]|nr:outer membrane beta-barrel protein [bacterium]